MALILSLETSTAVSSVALHLADELLAYERYEVPNSTASHLAILIQNVMKAGRKSTSDLNAMAISAGPGSYTGLRIGTATAKGMCYALGIPLMAVNTLEHMATKAQPECVSSDLLCPMLDARRMEVYSMLLNSQLDVLEPTAAKVITAESFEEWLTENRIVFFGTGADKCRNTLVHQNAHFLSDVAPSADWLGVVASQYFNKNQFVDVSLFEPFYLKDFVAKKPKSLF